MRPALPDRFTPRRVLGTGSFGDVWLAADSVRGADVAVKRLRHATGRTVGLFKEEFRRVADISHPNVVSLYELIPLDGEWFLTMEPILGTTPRGPVAWSDALPGIIAGLDALHTRGRLHRDIKASNILVDDDGRAVILDFGLNTQLGAASRVRGNLDAAAPEEVAGRPLGRASDFYALGATIARDLTGGSVFNGAGAEVLAQKLRHRAPPLAERVPELVAAHPDLAALVDAMLVRSPSERLAAMETPARALGCAPRTSRASWKLVGRKRERASLDAALKRARAGESVHVRIEGPPAIGKTALVNAWLDEPQEARDHRDFVTTCFDGRCVNLDHSDHRGLDDIVRALLAFYGEDGDRSSPFVSLRQLLAGGDEHAGDELVPRTRSEFLEKLVDDVSALLYALPDAIVPIIVLDDAHWGDSDSGIVLGRLRSRGHVLVTVHRRGLPPGGLLVELDELLPPQERIELGPLDDGDIHDLLRQGSRGHGEPESVARLATECGGQPYLARVLRDGSDAGGERVPELGAALRRRVSRLRPPARRLLEVVCLAPRPIASHVASACSDQGDSAFVPELELTRAHLLTRRHGSAGAMLEPLHQMVAETVRSDLAARGQLVDAHASIYRTLRRLDEPDFEVLAHHATAAGLSAEALASLQSAARVASSQFRFGLAADLMNRALGLARDVLDGAGVRKLQRELADAEGSAGRHLAAAATYATLIGDASITLSDLDTFQLAQRRAEHLLHAGRMEEGYAAMRTCLLAADLPAPLPRIGILPSIMRSSRWLAHNLDDLLKSPPAGQFTDTHATRIDLCVTAALSLTNVDSLRGAAYALTSARLAAESGDQACLARTLALTANYLGAAGPRYALWIERIAEHGFAFAERNEDARLEGTAWGALTIHRFHIGSHEQSLEHAVRAEAVFRRAESSQRERVTAQIYQIANLATLTRWDDVERERSRLYDDANVRGDRFAATAAIVALGFMSWLHEDRPGVLEQRVDAAMVHWGNVIFQVQHFFAVLARVRAALYRREASRAHAILDAARVPVLRSLLWRMPFARIQLREMRARAILAGLPRGRFGRSMALRRVERIASQIRAEPFACHEPLADVLCGAVDIERGALERGVRRLSRAADGFSAFGMLDRADAARAAVGLETSSSAANPDAYRRAVGWVP